MHSHSPCLHSTHSSLYLQPNLNSFLVVICSLSILAVGISVFLVTDFKQLSVLPSVCSLSASTVVPTVRGVTALLRAVDGYSVRVRSHLLHSELLQFAACECTCKLSTAWLFSVSVLSSSILSSADKTFRPPLCLPLEQGTNITLLCLKVMLSSLLLFHNFIHTYKISLSYSPPTLSPYPFSHFSSSQEGPVLFLLCVCMFICI